MCGCVSWEPDPRRTGKLKRDVPLAMSSPARDSREKTDECASVMSLAARYVWVWFMVKREDWRSVAGSLMRALMELRLLGD